MASVPAGGVSYAVIRLRRARLPRVRPERCISTWTMKARCRSHAPAAAVAAVLLGHSPLAFVTGFIFTEKYYARRPSGLHQAIKSEVLRESDTCSVESLGIDIPSGLRQTLTANTQSAIHKRFWIVDNSGSTSLDDGHCLLTSNDNGDEECSRWDEISETVESHIHLASSLGAPSEFRLLNPPKNGGPLVRGPHRFRVGYGLNTPSQASKDRKRARNIMLRNEPSGRTPLPDSIREVRRDIIDMLPTLEEEGSKVCIVIATDGQNTNKHNCGIEVQEKERQEDLVAALDSLRGLPVCVVIRLCTDWQPTLTFYNELDKRLDWLDIDVLDDHISEAEEVFEHNPWLTYARPLHRMREMGQDCRYFDLLDERPFCRREVKEFCALLFGCSDLIYYDWESFPREVDRLQKNERKQWNPKTNSLTRWIDIKSLASVPEE